MVKDLTRFSLTEVNKKLNSINVEITLEHCQPFPKSKERLLFWYEHRRRFVKITPQGYFNRARLVSSLIDFSFVRSLVAPCYSLEGGHCFDPASMFLLYLFKHIEHFRWMEGFCSCLHHQYNGRAYRIYAGISEDRIPCEADFSNFKIRIGKERFNAIFHVLVEIAARLELITGKILSTDGTLFPSFARYRGCNYASSICKKIKLKDDFIQRARTRVLQLLKNPSQIKLGKEMRFFAKCPKDLPQTVKKRPSFVAVSFCLVPFEEKSFNSDDKTAKVLGIEKELKKAGLMIKMIGSRISKIELDEEGKASIFVCCPKMPADLDAKIGYRRSKHNPKKKEKVFGFQVIIITSIEPTLGIELPVACITGPGSNYEGDQFIPLREEIKRYHSFTTLIDIGDSGLDKISNYQYSRDDGSISVFDYNRRNENLSPEALLKRGYNENGYPFGPCECVCRPNGYDKKDKRLCHVCAKQCTSCPAAVPKPISNCSHLKKPLGWSTHVPILRNLWAGPPICPLAGIPGLSPRSLEARLAGRR